MAKAKHTIGTDNTKPWASDIKPREGSGIRGVKNITLHLTEDEAVRVLEKIKSAATTPKGLEADWLEHTLGEPVRVTAKADTTDPYEAAVLAYYKQGLDAAAIKKKMVAGKVQLEIQKRVLPEAFKTELAF